MFVTGHQNNIINLPVVFTGYLNFRNELIIINNNVCHALKLSYMYIGKNKINIF